MKIIKRILLVLVGIIAVLLIVALFVSNDLVIEKEITINKPKQEVFNYVKYLKNQDNFSFWAMQDPNMKKAYTGTDGTVGFVTSWNSEKMGVGEQEIKGIAEGERLDFELRFKEPFEATDKAYMVTESVSENQTKVKWGFSSRMPYPMNLMCVFMKGELGNQLAAGLTNLKGVVEKQ